VTGPLVSIPFSIVLYLGLHFTLRPAAAIPVFCGVILAYLGYDMVHYTVHTYNFRNKLFKSLKRHHMKHHYQDPAHSFGLTSSLWDYVFNTTQKAIDKPEETKATEQVKSETLF
jgi:sterol desaturase/sphingolipid hydroxylase (fatty acid hydroxylase superfamily)